MSIDVERDWTTKAGLRAIAVLIPDMHRCGYVEVPKCHPLFGVDYNTEVSVLADFDGDCEIGKRSPMILFTAGVDAKDGHMRRSPDVVFDVHGGITFAGERLGGGWWFGFDCGHYNDGSLNPRICGDGPVRSQEYVEAECESLAEQIVRLTGREDAA